MNKYQKIGFLSQPIILLVIGVVFLIQGWSLQDRILKYIGMIWTPLGLINLALILVLIKKSK
ncbi:MAG: hypothetical protein GF421_06965 [Candidatus Aminicenantes bacterium]|nr:hypothetical protein [Candidatus Aminicenantes bacterium]